MSDKKVRLRAVVLLALFSFPFAWTDQSIRKTEKEKEKGDLSIYFLGEKVGYEEYVWEENERGYSLSVKGRMTKPVAIEVERLRIEMDKSFIPIRYVFKGSMGGIKQQVSSVFSDGEAVNTIKVSGQEQKNRVWVRRDAFLLPNPIFSPYMVIAKRFGCSLEEKKELSAYIIPQLETPFTLESDEENPCLLLLQLNRTVVELEIGEDGRLNTLWIPSQNLRVIHTSPSF
ncbi:MAG: hypothetical protein PVF22_00130 [Candidatus Aminicenantes bacterium]